MLSRFAQSDWLSQLIRRRLVFCWHYAYQELDPYLLYNVKLSERLTPKEQLQYAITAIAGKVYRFCPGVNRKYRQMLSLYIII